MVSAARLLARLAPEVAGELRADPATRELYAADASLYRRLPLAALRASRSDDLEAAVRACAETGVPLTMRGAGTSLAGQAVGRGLVVDTTALSRIEIDPDARVARVGPGAVLDDLNAAAAEHGLILGPDVATSNRATLGGMISNNSAGARSVVHGLTADAVRALDVVMADGARATLRRGTSAPPVLESARALAARFRAPALLRRVSGYDLGALGGDAPDWPRVLCGAEGTLAVICEAELQLVPIPESRGLALVPFASIDDALGAVVDLLADGPSAIELMDAETLDPANRPPAIAALLGDVADAPATLVVEHSGAREEVAARVGAISGARAILEPEAQARIWAVRRSGIARALRAERGGVGPDPRPIPVIEDPAVPPDRLAAFAAEARRMLADLGVPALWYGHASVGCLHVRPLVDLRAPGAVGLLRRMAEGMADVVVAHGGSLSGEHGDGRLRSELLPRMYPADTIAAFAELKRRLDPAGIMNPGIIVDPEPLDDGLRIAASPPRAPMTTAVDFSREGGLRRAAEACNGNGACRSRAGAMCPSYQALRDERHSTRGRATLLRAALEGHLDGASDPGLQEALALCLSCKACAAECPAGVDMSRLKVEALARGRADGAPLRARMLGSTHALLALGSRAPRLASIAAAIASRRVGRRLPRPVRPWRPPPTAGEGPAHLVVADTFTRYLEPENGDAAVRVLVAAGARTATIAPGCCGRPFLSQGLVGPARRAATGLLDRLAPAAVAGWRLVVLEPSCWSMVVDDLPELVPHDPRARLVAKATVPFERALLDLGVPPLRAATEEIRAVVHPHCHARALGADDGMALASLVPGLRAVRSAAGCCGMAGAFGYEHPSVSRRIAEDRLIPGLADAQLAVAAGTSCRAQARELAGVRAVHPAVLLAGELA